MVPVACSSAPVEVGGRRGAVVVFRDVTARRAAEEAARREEAERAHAQEVRASRARLMEAGDAERRRLGRDLHDGAQQRLVHVVIDLQRARSRLTDGDPAVELLDAALTQTRAAIADLRELAAGLDPSILTNKGLRAAVESLTARSPFAVRIDIPDRRFPRHVETTAYFVIAEALTNVAKHARANAASVRVAPDGDVLEIDVRDDGVGGADIAAGTGLRGLSDRLAAVDGRLEVDGGPDVARGGGGTHVHAELPLLSAAGDGPGARSPATRPGS
jgi:signal transduction histidine kinase